MIFGASEIIMFGVKAGVRLYGQARQAYVEQTLERALTLPLPGLDHKVTGSLARAYYQSNKQGQQHRAESNRVQDLHAKAMVDLQIFKRDDPQGAADYIAFCEMHTLEDQGHGAEAGLLLADRVALVTIGQWRRGERPHPTAVRRIAGTLVEIGIDYFASGPGRGKLGGNSPTSLVLAEVVNALDDHSFVSDGLELAVEKIFLATLDVMAENPAVVSGDPKVRSFVSGVARGVVADVQQRLAALDKNERLFAAARLSETARAVFHSVVRSGAEVVLENPGTYLGVDPGGEEALAGKLGTIILDTVLPVDGDGVDLSALVAGDTLDELVKGTLYVIAEHPELMGLEHPEIEGILQEIAGELAVETVKLGPDLFPAVARLVLEKTAENLEVLWAPEVPGQPEVRNLAVTAVKALLSGLARPPAAGRWQPRLSASLVLEVVEISLDEVAENPTLLTRLVAGKPALDAAIGAILDGLAEQKLAHFSAAAAAEILTLGLQAAAERWEMLEELPGDAGANRLALTGIIDMVFAVVAGADERAAWRLAQDRVLVAIFELVFAKLAEFGINRENLAKARTALEAVVARLAAGGPFSLVDLTAELQNSLAA